jgi:hypothetical protein
LKKTTNLKTFPSKVVLSFTNDNIDLSDWTDAESQSQYTNAPGGTLWAEEWEDETEETDFSVQLKYYLLFTIEHELICVFRQELEKVKVQNSQKMQT